MADLTAKVTLRAEDRFSGAAGKAAAAGGKLARRMKGLGSELAGLDRRDSAVRKMRALQSGLGRTGQALDAARRRTAMLGRELAAAENPTKKLQRSFEAARRKSDLLKRSHRSQRDAARGMREELRAAGVDTRRLGEAQRGIAGDIERATRRMERMAQATGRVDAAQKRLDRSLARAARGALVAGELRNLGRGALDLVRSPLERVREVGRARGGLARLGMSEAGIGAVVERGRALSLDFAGIDPARFTAAAYDIRSAISGLSEQGVADFTSLAALTGRATQASTEEMTGLFATAYGSFKESLYGDVSDRQFGGVFAAQLASTVKQFATTGPKMMQAIQSMGSGLATSGVSMEDQLAALGMLQVKMQPGEAGTTLAALERTAAVAEERFAKMGLGIRTLDERGNLLAPSELLREVHREFGDELTTREGALIQEGFGSEEAVKFFKAMRGQHDAMRANAAALREGGQKGEGLVRAIVRLGENNVHSRLEKLQQRWNEIQLQVGEALVPALELAVPWIEKVAKGVSWWIEKFPGTTAVMAGLTAGAGLLALGLAPVITAIYSAGLAFAWMRKQAAGFSATAATRGIGEAGGPGRFGRSAKRIRGAGGKFRGAAGKALGSLKGKGGLLGAAAGTVAIGSTLANRELSGREKTGLVVAEGGALAGALAGAALGSVIPGLGTAVGGIVGAILGGAVGGRLGSAVGDRIVASAESAGTAPERPNARQLRGLAPRLTAAALAAPLALGAAAGPPGTVPGDASPASVLAAEAALGAGGEDAAAPVTAREGFAGPPEPARPERPVRPAVTWNVRISIHQVPGESADELADRVLEKLEHAQRQGRLEGLYDAD